MAKIGGDGVEEGWFKKATMWKLGNGASVRFWEDAWLCSTSLKTMYPRLYSLSCDQGKSVREVGNWEEDRWRWEVSWRRDRFEWESSMESDFLSMLNRGTCLLYTSDAADE